MNRREKDPFMKNRTRVLVFLITLIVTTGFFLPVHATQAVTCNGFPDAFSRIAVSADGNYVATGDPISKTVRLLEKDGTPVWGYKIRENISSLSISDDGGIVAATTDDGRVFGWDTKGELLWNFEGMGRFTQVMLTTDGGQGFIVNSDSPSNPYTYTIHQFDRNGTLRWETREPGISGASIIPDGKFLAVSTSVMGTSEVRSYAGNGTVLWRYPAPDGIRFVAVSPDNNTIVAVHSYRIIVLDHKGELISEVIPRDHPATLDVSPDGSYIVTGGKFGLQVFNRSGYLLWQKYEQDTNGIAISRDGRTIISSSQKTVSLFDKSGTRIHMVPVDTTIGGIAISADGNTIAAGSYNDTVFLLDRDGKAKRLSLGILPVQSLPPVRTTTVNTSGSSQEPGAKTQAGQLLIPVILTVLGACAIVVIFQRWK
jgi:WD40 repeat protein